MLNRSGKSRHSYFVPHLSGKAFSFCPLSMMLAVGFSCMAFIMFRYAPSTSTSLRVFIINGCCILSNAFFCIYWYDHVIFSFLLFCLYYIHTHIYVYIHIHIYTYKHIYLRFHNRSITVVANGEISFLYFWPSNNLLHIRTTSLSVCLPI